MNQPNVKRLSPFAARSAAMAAAAAGLALLSMAALTACSNASRTAAPWPPARVTVTPAPAPSNAPVPVPAESIRRLTVTDARSEYEAGRAVIVDVRGDAAYKAGHIKGSKAIALSEIVARAEELPRDKLIILYCSCPTEHSSVAAAQALAYAHVDNTAALLGGYTAWKLAGYPVEEDESHGPQQ